MKRRDVLGAFAAAGALAAMPITGQQRSPAPAAGTPAKVQRKGRIKQGLWRSNFGADTKLSFDDMCREAARLGCYGFDLIDPADWPTLRKHGLEPLLAGAGPVTFENGIIHPEVHASSRRRYGRTWIDCARDERVPTIITIGGQRRGMPYEQGADNAVAFLNRIKGQLEERSVTIAIENMNNRRLDPRVRPRGSDFRPLGMGRRRLRARQLARTSSSSAISITCRSWTATSRRTCATRFNGSRISTRPACRRATRSTSARR